MDIYQPGIVTALSVAVRAFTEKRDKVLILTPVYPPFFAVVTENGRELVCSSLVVENGHYEVDWADFEDKLRQGVKLFILCNSHNPVGRVWRAEELKRMGDLCCKYGVLILSDEIHADLALPGFKHTVMASLSEDIAAHTLTAMAPSKTFNIAGMMNSLIVSSSSELLGKYNREMLALHLDVGNIFGHVTLKAAYRAGGEWLEELRIYLGRNVDFADEYIRHELPYVKMLRPEGSFLLWLDFRPTGLRHEEVGRILTEKARVGLNDGSASVKKASASGG
nr:aminotransferase class I/II-fold pyridoxal phosphate-dependent enzyme [Odoribacter sp. OF09-27XD]